MAHKESTDELVVVAEYCADKRYSTLHEIIQIEEDQANVHRPGGFPGPGRFRSGAGPPTIAP